MPASSSLSRPRDQYISLFLCSFVPTILFFDCVPLYPPHLVPAPLLQLQNFYHETFADPLLATKPHWFRCCSYIELFYELPLAVWIAAKLRSGKASGTVYVNMLVWAVVCALTTALCVWEFVHSAEEMTDVQRWGLVGMYGGYLGIFGAMAWDVAGRLVKGLDAGVKRD